MESPLKKPFVLRWLGRFPKNTVGRNNNLNNRYALAGVLRSAGFSLASQPTRKLRYMFGDNLSAYLDGHDRDVVGLFLKPHEATNVPQQFAGHRLGL